MLLQFGNINTSNLGENTERITRQKILINTKFSWMKFNARVFFLSFFLSAVISVIFRDAFPLFIRDTFHIKRISPKWRLCLAETQIFIFLFLSFYDFPQWRFFPMKLCWTFHRRLNHFTVTALNFHVMLQESLKLMIWLS